MCIYAHTQIHPKPFKKPVFFNAVMLFLCQESYILCCFLPGWRENWKIPGLLSTVGRNCGEACFLFQNT